MRMHALMHEVGSWLASAGVGLASTLAAQTSLLIEARASNERWAAALAHLDATVASVVRDLEQHHVEPVREASPAGKLGDATKRLLRTAALTLVRQQLGPTRRDELSRVLGFGELVLDDDALDRFITTRIEAHVFVLRLCSNGRRGGRPRHEGRGTERS